MNDDTTFLLVHGSWHVGDCWSAVAAHLREAGFPVATPTLAGHGADCNRDVTHDDYVHSVVAALDRLPGEIALGIPSAYISCRQDRALPQGSFHPGQSSRLDSPQLIEIDGDHEALLTAPRQLAWALLEAVRSNRARDRVAA